MEKPKLTSGDVNLYAASQGLLTMMFTVPTLYGTMFMTDYLGIPAVAIGTAMLITKILDFVICVVAGPIIEKSNMKWGKYISWIKILTWTLFFGAILQMFDTTKFVGSPILRLVIVCIGYVSFHGSMNFNATARGSLVPKLAGADMNDRRKLTSRQAQVGAAVSIISSLITLPTINFFKPIVGETAGYFIVTLLFGCVFLIANTLFVKKASKFDPPTDKASAKKTATIKEMVESITSNGQMLILVLSYTLFTIGSQVYAGVTTYYFRTTGNFGFMTVALTSRSIVAFLSSLCVPAIGKKIGKKGALVLGRVLYACSCVVIWLFGLKSKWIMTACMCICQAATYMYMTFGVNYYLDCGEYGYYKTGKDNRTIAVAVMNIPTKIGFAIGGALVGYGIAWAGYIPPVGEVAPAFTYMNRYMMVVGLLPAIFVTLSAIITIFFYKMTDEKAAEYAKANAEREAAEKAAQA